MFARIIITIKIRINNTNNSKLQYFDVLTFISSHFQLLKTIIKLMTEYNSENDQKTDII